MIWHTVGRGEGTWAVLVFIQGFRGVVFVAIGYVRIPKSKRAVDTLR